MLNHNTSSASSSALRFISWNVKGLNSPVKRNKVFDHLRSLNTKIAFLQETHLKPSDHLKLRRGWVGQLYHSSFSSKARGTAILVHKSVPLSVSKVISDPNGRFNIVTGKIFGSTLTLANVYGPNWDNEDFYKNFLFSLPDLVSSQLILGGDFNCCLDPSLDRSSKKPPSQSKSSKIIQLFMEQYAVSDVWRFFNPSDKQFSFFSPVHGTFSRIDLFLIDNKLLSTVCTCFYSPIVISDHATVIMDISFPGVSLTRSPWRFNSFLLTDLDFIETINSHIDLFISTNVNPEMSASTIWEACKAFLRGEIISYSAFRKKNSAERGISISKDLMNLQSKCAAAPDPELIKDLLIKKSEFDILAADGAIEALLKSRHNYYESGDKPGKILAHQIRQSASTQHILQINTIDGTTINPQTINDQFRSFYSSLYASECSSEEAEFDVFFSPLNIPSIDPETSSRLEEPFTVDEIKGALLSMQSGKCPGPDGLPTEFFKAFADKLSPLLLNMFNESLQSGILPQTLRQATISLILKKGKDPLLCSNYRPISLLCADVKILAKMLARRLEAVLPSIISTDQTGFVKGRHSFHNIRRLFDVLYSPSTSTTPELVISMDAEKAFDRVEWPYLFYTLKRFGLGSTFISWIKLLYASPLARVRTNNNYSDYFPLRRGTRQGCPLSPLLFAIAIEPLAVALRFGQMMGITRGGSVHKLSLYADDLLLFISDPDRSIPQVLALLKEFGQVSGYKLNFHKSELMPINSAAIAYPLSKLPFKTSLDHFNYLGICVTKNYSDLFNCNFSPLLDQMTKDFQRWSLLPLSLAGRINSIKMNILPKFLYLFQCIPVFIPKRFFHSLDSSISQFIWNGKTPRIRKGILQKTKELGGLELPNFLFYYWAANVRNMLFWCSSDDQPPPWLRIEEAACGKSSLMSLLCLPLSLSPLTFSKNVIVKNCLKIWCQFRRHFTVQSTPLLCPVHRNPLFPPSLTDKAFAAWLNRGIISIKHLYFDGTFASFEHLSQVFNLPGSHFFRYLQVRDFVRKQFPGFPMSPPSTLVDSIFNTNPYQRGAISTIYNTLFAHQPLDSDCLRITWARDLNIEIDAETWQLVLKRVHNSSVCARHGVLQCKVVYRVHWSKSKLARMFPNIDPCCDKCHLEPANLAHMFWTCPALSLFWESVFDSLSATTSVKLSPSPLIGLFGVLPSDYSMPSHFIELVAFLTLLARRCILMHWKGPHAPSHTRWIKDALFFIKLEKIKHSLRGSIVKFSKIWLPFLEHVRTLQLDAVSLD